jgi:hypothetical protein
MSPRERLISAIEISQICGQLAHVFLDKKEKLAFQIDCVQVLNELVREA